jgi:putative PIN family toxin of toxin-antitoxin system
VTPHPESAPPGDLPGACSKGAESQGSAPVLFSVPPRRVVFDTNLLVSLYIFADSRFAPLRSRIEHGDWLALTSDACFEEFRRVLGYPMFRLTPDQQSVALSAYASTARQLPPLVADEACAALPRCKDRDDQKFLELARDGRAEYLVTADKALLKLARGNRLRGLFRILTPEAALAEAVA